MNNESKDFRNIGKYNNGHWNSGDQNLGNHNSGSYNNGDWNSGSFNCGAGNSGNHNNGNWNSGRCNSGHRNTGEHNIGNWNSGDWNKCNFSSGCFNTKSSKIYLFNKPSDWTYRDWLESEANNLLSDINYDLLVWVSFENMTDEEKTDHPDAEITDGYLKKLDDSECAVIWWRTLSDRQKSVITSIPNFDKKIFKKITGIDVDAD